MPKNEESRFAAIAATYHVMILAGLVRKENGKLYNSIVFWGRDGKILDVYKIRQSTTSIGVTHRMGVGKCLLVTY